MIELEISNADHAHLKIRDRLENMAVARKVIFSDQIQTPILRHNLNTFKGLTAIENYLDEFQHFHKQWYQCLCD